MSSFPCGKVTNAPQPSPWAVLKDKAKFRAAWADRMARAVAIQRGEVVLSAAAGAAGVVGWLLAPRELSSTESRIDVSDGTRDVTSSEPVLEDFLFTQGRTEGSDVGICLLRKDAGDGGYFKHASCVADDGHVDANCLRCRKCAVAKSKLLLAMAKHAGGDVMVRTNARTRGQGPSAKQAAIDVGNEAKRLLSLEKKRVKRLLKQLDGSKKACGEGRGQQSAQSCSHAMQALNEALVGVGVDKALPEGTAARDFFDAELKNIVSRGKGKGASGSRCSPALFDYAMQTLAALGNVKYDALRLK